MRHLLAGTSPAIAVLGHLTLSAPILVQRYTWLYDSLDDVVRRIVDAASYTGKGMIQAHHGIIRSCRSIDGPPLAPSPRGLRFFWQID